MNLFTKRVVAGALLLGLISLAPGMASAQVDEDYNLSISGSGTTDIGDGPMDSMPLFGTLDLAVILDSSAGDPMQGYQWGMCHDDELLEELVEEDIVNGAALDDVSFTFQAIEVWPDVDAGILGHGWTVGALFNVITQATLPAEADHEMFVVTYTAGADAGFAVIEFCETLNSPEVTVRVIVDGEEIEPAQVSVEVEVGGVEPYHLRVGGDTPDSTLTGNSIDIPITVDCTGEEPDLDSFSFGVSHDNDIVRIDDVQPGAALADLNDGDGPSYFAANLEPVGGDGFTVGCVLSFGPVFELISGLGQEVAIATYVAAPGAELDTTSNLDFTADLGDPVVPILVSLNTDVVIADMFSGSILVTIEPNPTFLRGDCNDDGVVDISDPFYLASDLFADGAPVACADSADIDDTGTLGILDAMLLLEYLFTDGDAPAAPFPDCGNDAPTVEEDTDGLGCETDHSSC